MLNVFDNSPLCHKATHGNISYFRQLEHNQWNVSHLPPFARSSIIPEERETSVNMPIFLPPAEGWTPYPPGLKAAATFSALRATSDNRKSRFYQVQDLSLHWETARGLRGEKPGLISNKTIRWLLQAHWARFPAEDYPAKTTAKMNFLWCININFILFNARPNLFVDIFGDSRIKYAENIPTCVFSI